MAVGLRFWLGSAVRSGALLAVAALGLGAAPRPAAAWDLPVCAAPNSMPFSRQGGEGFENRIMAALADALGATLRFVWVNAGTAIDNELRIGECDVIMGVDDGHPALLPTLAYYRSPYVFVQRADRPFEVNMFDDPALEHLQVGVQAAGGPVHDALLSRHLEDSIHGFYDGVPQNLIADIVDGVVDTGIMWGPIAGYLAAQAPVPLKILPVTPDIEPPFTPMFITMVIGVRRGDDALRDALNTAIAQRWDEIGAALEALHIPVMPLQRPILTRQ